MKKSAFELIMEKLQSEGKVKVIKGKEYLDLMDDINKHNYTYRKMDKIEKIQKQIAELEKKKKQLEIEERIKERSLYIKKIEDYTSEQKIEIFDKMYKYLVENEIKVIEDGAFMDDSDHKVYLYEMCLKTFVSPKIFEYLRIVNDRNYPRR
jgi:predicted Zn-dependent protease